VLGFTNTLQPREKSRYQLKKQPRQARSKATVEAILEAATRILVSSGYSAATTNAIAQQAGVSIGSLYEYFPGKEAIFSEVRRREALRHFQRLTGGVQPTHPGAMLRFMISTHVAYVRDNLDIYVALETKVPRFAFEETENAVIEQYTVLSNAFLESRREVLSPTNDISFISELLLRVVYATTKDYALRSPEALFNPELTEALIKLVGKYLLDESPRRRTPPVTEPETGA
tara:strand:+ start:2434 stop:3123 length:690 start_codon:yes stop_codon:yes gene_type:complete